MHGRVLRSRSKRLPLNLHPADAAILLILIVATLVAAFGGRRPELLKLVLIHASLLGAYILFLIALSKWGRLEWVATIRPMISMAVIWTLYCTLGELGMAAMPFRADSALNRIDVWLFAGHNPTFLFEHWQTPGRVEFFAFFYGWFIPYINLSLLVGSIGRPPVERNQFLTGWVFTYCISYLGYIFLPGQGPGGFLSPSYHVPLQGAYFYHSVVNAVAATGGLRGVFPSLHVGSALYLCLFDLRNRRLRGLTYLPVVLMIYVATLVLRYHYVIDLLVGTIIASSCVWIGPQVFLKWMQWRRREGLPALPEGAVDDLSHLPSDGAPGRVPVLPTGAGGR